jgi:hypothetical protein
MIYSGYSDARNIVYKTPSTCERLYRLYYLGSSLEFVLVNVGFEVLTGPHGPHLTALTVVAGSA